MYWRNCNNDPPQKAGEYIVLILEDNMWKECFGQYSTHYKNWELWIDGFGWSGDSGYEPQYWFELPQYPPIPYKGPICEYFYNNYCSAQKNIPRCFCQGDKNKCEK